MAEKSSSFNRKLWCDDTAYSVALCVNGMTKISRLISILKLYFFIARPLHRERVFIMLGKVCYCLWVEKNLMGE